MEDELQRWCWVFVHAAQSGKSDRTQDQGDISAQLKDLCHWVFDSFIEPTQSLGDAYTCDIAHIVHAYISNDNSGPFKKPPRSKQSTDYDDDDDDEKLRLSWKKRVRIVEPVPVGDDMMAENNGGTTHRYVVRRSKSVVAGMSSSPKKRPAPAAAAAAPPPPATARTPKSRRGSQKKRSTRRTTTPSSKRRGSTTSSRRKSPGRVLKSPSKRRSVSRERKTVRTTPKTSRRSHTPTKRSSIRRSRSLTGGMVSKNKVKRTSKLAYLRDLPYYGGPKRRRSRDRSKKPVTNTTSSGTLSSSVTAESPSSSRMQLDKENPFFSKLLATNSTKGRKKTSSTSSTVRSRSKRRGSSTQVSASTTTADTSEGTTTSNSSSHTAPSKRRKSMKSPARKPKLVRAASSSSMAAAGSTATVSGSRRRSSLVSPSSRKQRSTPSTPSKRAKPKSRVTSPPKPTPVKPASSSLSSSSSSSSRVVTAAAAAATPSPIAVVVESDDDKNDDDEVSESTIPATTTTTKDSNSNSDNDIDMKTDEVQGVVADGSDDDDKQSTTHKLPVLPQSKPPTSIDRYLNGSAEMDAPELSVIEDPTAATAAAEQPSPPPPASNPPAKRRPMLRRRQSMPNIPMASVAALASKFGEQTDAVKSSLQDCKTPPAAARAATTLDDEIKLAAKEAARRAALRKWKMEQESLDEKMKKHAEIKKIKANREKFEADRAERLRELKQQNRERREKEALVDFMLQIPCIYMSTQTAERTSDRETRDIKWLLEKLQVTHRVVDLSTNPEERDHVFEESGKTELPMVFVNDEYRGGWDEIKRANEENRLYALLDPFMSFDVDTFMRHRNIKAVTAKSRKAGRMGRVQYTGEAGSNRYTDSGAHEGAYNPIKPNVGRRTFERIKQDPSWANVYFGSSKKLKSTRSMSVVVSKEEMQKYIYQKHRGLKVAMDYEQLTTRG